MSDRIVSLVPSTSATLAYAGLSSSIVGCTNFCVDPTNLHRSAQIVGGTKDPDVTAVLDLKPDIVFMNEEENRREDYEALAQHVPVHISCPKKPADVIGFYRDMNETLGGGQSQLLNWAEDLQRLLVNCRSESGKVKESCIYMIWKNPYMGVGADTFIDAMLDLFGYDNLLRLFPDRYPSLSTAELNSISPQTVFLASEPYPFRKRDCTAIEQLFPDAQILKADGKLMSWHGYHTNIALEAFLNRKSAQGQRSRLWQSF